MVKSKDDIKMAARTNKTDLACKCAAAEVDKTVRCGLQRRVVGLVGWVGLDGGLVTIWKRGAEERP